MPVLQIQEVYRARDGVARSVHLSSHDIFIFSSSVWPDAGRDFFVKDTET